MSENRRAAVGIKGCPRSPAIGYATWVRWSGSRGEGCRAEVRPGGQRGGIETRCYSRGVSALNGDSSSLTLARRIYLLISSSLLKGGGPWREVD